SARVHRFLDCPAAAARKAGPAVSGPFPWGETSMPTAWTVETAWVTSVAVGLSVEQQHFLPLAAQQHPPPLPQPLLICRWATIGFSGESPGAIGSGTCAPGME